MLSTRAKTYFILSILIYIWFLKIETTSADIFAERSVVGNKLAATTVSLSLRSSVNNLKKQSLFNINGLLPDGFDIGTIKIVKDGKMEFKYILKVIAETNDPLCEQLDLEITKKDLTKIYNGKLRDVAVKETIPSIGFENWILILKLQKFSEELKNKNCNFKIQMKTYKIRPDEKVAGLHAESELENSVITGNW